MRSPVRPTRRFTFDHPVSVSDAVDTIKAALDDEGLHLLPPIVGGDRIRLVRNGPYDEVFVPGSRIEDGRAPR